MRAVSDVCLCVQVKAALDEILEKLPEEFNLVEMMGKVEERTPYIVVAFQECERMNFLTEEIKRSLKELNLGLKVRHKHTQTPVTEWLAVVLSFQPLLSAAVRISSTHQMLIRWLNDFYAILLKSDMQSVIAFFAHLLE